jgi:hypothetical protein
MYFAAHVQARFFDRAVLEGGDRTMAGGNFSDLTIDANGRVAPSGPLPLASDEDMLALYAWVIQENEDKTGAVCVAFEEAPRFRSRVEWTTRDDPHHWGRFRPGPATGVAVAVSRLGHAEPHVHWWTESFQLRGAAHAARRMGMGGPGGDGTGRIAELLEEILRILQGGGQGAQAAPGIWNPNADRSGRVAELLEEALRINRGG